MQETLKIGTVVKKVNILLIFYPMKVVSDYMINRRLQKNSSKFFSGESQFTKESLTN